MVKTMLLAKIAFIAHTHKFMSNYFVEISG